MDHDTIRSLQLSDCAYLGFAKGLLTRFFPQIIKGTPGDVYHGKSQWTCRRRTVLLRPSVLSLKALRVQHFCRRCLGMRVTARMYALGLFHSTSFPFCCLRHNTVRTFHLPTLLPRFCSSKLVVCLPTLRSSIISATRKECSIRSTVSWLRLKPYESVHAICCPCLFDLFYFYPQHVS